MARGSHLAVPRQMVTPAPNCPPPTGQPGINQTTQHPQNMNTTETPPINSTNACLTPSLPPAEAPGHHQPSTTSHQPTIAPEPSDNHPSSINLAAPKQRAGGHHPTSSRLPKPQ